MILQKKAMETNDFLMDLPEDELKDLDDSFGGHIQKHSLNRSSTFNTKEGY